MKVIHLFIISILAVGLVGCNTPKEIKTLSTTVTKSSKALTSSYQADLEHLQKVLELTKAHMEATHDTAQKSIKVSGALGRAWKSSQAQQVKAMAMLRFEEAALEKFTVALPTQLTNQFNAALNGYAKKLQADENARRAASEADPTSASATREYAKAIIARSKFILKAKEAEAEFRAKMQTVINEERRSYSNQVDAFLRTTFPDVYDLTADAARAEVQSALSSPPVASPYNKAFEPAFADLQKQREAVNGLIDALDGGNAEIDRYLQSNGYRSILLGAAIKGVWEGVSGKLGGLPGLIGKLKVPDLAKNFLTQQFHKSVKGIDNKIPDFTSKIDDLVNKAMTNVETAASKKLADLTDTMSSEK